MGIKHIFTSGVSDGADATLVQPGDWNDIHKTAWTEVTGTSQSAAVNEHYLTNNASLVTVTLPTTAAVGDMLTVQGLGAGGWKIAQNASEQIIWMAGGVDSSHETTVGTGGSLASTDRYDAVTLICITANTTWVVHHAKGVIDLV
jgi:hypothetical protein